MLDIHRKKFEDIVCSTNGKKQAVLLANLMTQMENHYNLSMIKEIFERETIPEVKALYLEVSNARKF